MARVEQRKIATIDRGLFLVRYAAAEDEARPPKVKVSVDPSRDNDILLVLHPDHADATLSQPGSCVVVMATRPGELIVEVTPSRRNGSSGATVKSEPLTQGAAEPAQTFEPTLAGSGLRVLGHVAGIGDVFAGAQEWLAGPSAPSRIEGIAIEWPDKPKDLTPVFKTVEDRREAALGKYRGVVSKFAGTGAATLARLAEGSLLLDKRDPDGAASAFLDAKSSPLAQADSEVRGRALEGLGFAYELKAVVDSAQKDKHLDDALKL